jgi:competence protein ComEA
MMKTACCILLFAYCLLPPAYGHFAQTSGERASRAKRPVAIIDINDGTAEEFTTLPGIGPELARRIVAYREKHGAFRRVEDLLVIKGMGHKKWRAIRPYIRVGS